MVALNLPTVRAKYRGKTASELVKRFDEIRAATEILKAPPVSPEPTGNPYYDEIPAEFRVSSKEPFEVRSARLRLHFGLELSTDAALVEEFERAATEELRNA